MPGDNQPIINGDAPPRGFLDVPEAGTWEYPDAHRCARSENEFRKVAPRFRFGQESWDIFIESFKSVSQGYPSSTTMWKNILYNSLEGEAKTLACPDMDPSKEPMKSMTGLEYADILRNLYEPEAESSMMQLSFISRVQQSGEHVTTYFKFKLGMYKRAYPENARYWPSFYDEVTKGLINPLIKLDMRKFTPNPISDTSKFLNHLLLCTSALQKAFLSQEISEQEIMGCEARPTMVAYQGIRGDRGYPAIKTEPVNAINHQNKTCYACGSREHFIAQCPKKQGSKRYNVNNLQEAVQYDETEEQSVGINNVVPKTYVYRSSPGGFKRNQTKSKPFRKFVAVVEDSEGNLILEEELEEGNSIKHAHGKATTTAPAVNAVGPEVDSDETHAHVENDYVPSSFLG
jgi:hypothetical protein